MASTVRHFVSKVLRKSLARAINSLRSTTERLGSESMPSGTPEPQMLVDLRGSVGDGVSTLGPLGPDNAPFGAPETQRLVDLHGLESDGETSETLSTISNVLGFPVPFRRASPVVRTSFSQLNNSRKPFISVDARTGK